MNNPSTLLGQTLAGIVCQLCGSREHFVGGCPKQERLYQSLEDWKGAKEALEMVFEQMFNLQAQVNSNFEELVIIRGLLLSTHKRKRSEDADTEPQTGTNTSSPTSPPNKQTTMPPPPPRSRSRSPETPKHHNTNYPSNRRRLN